MPFVSCFLFSPSHVTDLCDRRTLQRKCLVNTARGTQSLIPRPPRRNSILTTGLDRQTKLQIENISLRKQHNDNLIAFMGSFAESLLPCWRSEIHVCLLPISTNTKNNTKTDKQAMLEESSKLLFDSINNKKLWESFVCFQHQQTKDKKTTTTDKRSHAGGV